MNKYIVSLVLAKKVDNGANFDIQNVVNILQAMDEKEAADKAKTRVRLQYPGHRIIVQVVIDMANTPAHEIN